MKIPENIKDGLNVVLNESSILEVILNEDDNFIIIKLELLRENGDEKANFANLKLENLKKYIASYRTDIRNENKVLKFEPKQINKYLQNFINKDVYGWDFFNVENSNFNFSELSFEFLKDTEFDKYNCIELFQEDLDEDLIFKIWFENFKILNENNEEICVKELINKQNNIWETIFKK